MVSVIIGYFSGETELNYNAFDWGPGLISMLLLGEPLRRLPILPKRYNGRIINNLNCTSLWSGPRIAASPIHPFMRKNEATPASLTLSRRSYSSATPAVGRKNIKE